ncbi:MAG: exodeoxyribonuclease III [Candidatus Riflebacteria bacterium]|nr:exodeoxyribonuclease III [Candidatus Riflebacteria bacterium]
MKICTFNVNGIRARLHQLEKLIEKHSPDIIGVQEIKCVDDAFPKAVINSLGYHVESFGQKGHYGVALLSKTKPITLSKGFPNDNEDSQKRIISATYELDNNETIKLINGYFPQGENREHTVKFPAKKKFYEDLLSFLANSFSPKDNLIIMGDMNVAPNDLDIGIGEHNKLRWLKTGKCSFLPEERDWLNGIKNWGIYDLFRELHPNDSNLYSWFDYRSDGFRDNRGLRIDLILGTQAIKRMCRSIEIDYEIRGMEKPSDHCPVIATIIS